MGDTIYMDDTYTEAPYFCPTGPLELVYGAESPVNIAEITSHISSAKKRRRPIDNLSFYQCQFKEGTRKVFRTLGKKLKRVHNVRELAINGILGVGNEELVALAPFLNSSLTLRSLDLTGAEFDAKGIQEIRPFFRRNSSLEVLVLGENRCVGDEGVEAVTSALQSNQGGLQVLAIESCGVGPRGASSVSNFMMNRGSSLRILELSNNKIGDVGAETLVGAIRHSQHKLGHLGLNNTNLGDGAALAFGEMLQSNNRSLHTLSLQNNKGITSVGASSLLKAVYNTESIKTIIGSNHVLKNLNLRGCTSIDTKLLQLTTQLSAHTRMLSSRDEVIRIKVKTYLKNSQHGIALEDYDLELMPHILEFVGKTNGMLGMTSLFRTLKSIPLLYTQYDPQAIKALEGATKFGKKEKKAGAGEGGESTTRDNNGVPFLEQLRLSSRRARQYYSIFSNLIPKQSSMLRYTDRRTVNKHEVGEASVCTANNNNQCYLSSNHTAAAVEETASSFIELNYYIVQQAILMWLYHTRCAGLSTPSGVPKLVRYLKLICVYCFCPQACG